MWKQFVRPLIVCGGLALAGCQSAGNDDRATAAQPAAGAPPVEVDRRSAALFEQALAAIQSERYADAEVLLKELTVRDPSLSGPWVNLGSVYEALGDTAAAEHAYKKAIDANPNNCAAYTDLGVLARRQGDFLTAEANYLACISRVPDFREAHLNLGILYELYLGRLDDALNAYQTYQTLCESPDLRVGGWVAELQRRLAGSQS